MEKRVGLFRYLFLVPIKKEPDSSHLYMRPVRRAREGRCSSISNSSIATWKKSNDLHDHDAILAFSHFCFLFCFLWRPS